MRVLNTSCMISIVTALAYGLIIAVFVPASHAANPPTIGTPKLLSPETNCFGPTEGVAVKMPGGRYVVHYNTGGVGNYNFETSVGTGATWGTTPLTSTVPAGFTQRADAWVVASQNTGLFYFSDIFDTATQRCNAVGATSFANIANPAAWNFPMTCATPLGSQAIFDGPMITMDDGQRTLYLLDSGQDSNLRTYVFPNCTSSPLYAGCTTNTCVNITSATASTSCPSVAGGAPGGVKRFHPTGLAHNSSNSSAGRRLFVAYLDSTSRTMLASYNPTTGTILRWVLANGTWPPSGCTGPSGSQCIQQCTAGTFVRIWPRPSLSIDTIAGRTYLNIAWQKNFVGNVDGLPHLGTDLKVLDITSVDAPVVTRWLQSNGNNTFDLFMPIVLSMLSQGKSGWFAYSNNMGACSTYLRGFTTVDNFASIADSNISVNTFPITTNFIGDYIGGTSDWVAGANALFPTWVEPINSDAACASAHRHIRGNHVTPQ